MVFSVGDGDTIRVTGTTGANKTTVRLACIDAPETSQAPYGNDARQALPILQGFLNVLHFQGVNRFQGHILRLD